MDATTSAAATRTPAASPLAASARTTAASAQASSASRGAVDGSKAGTDSGATMRVSPAAGWCVVVSSTANRRDGSHTVGDDGGGCGGSDASAGRGGGCAVSVAAAVAYGTGRQPAADSMPSAMLRAAAVASGVGAFSSAASTLVMVCSDGGAPAAVSALTAATTCSGRPCSAPIRRTASDRWSSITMPRADSACTRAVARAT